MKHNVSRLLSLVLALVMLVGVLPLSAREVSAEAARTVNTMTDTIYDNTFDEAQPSWTSSSVSSITRELDETVTQNGTGKSFKYTYKSAAAPQPYFYINHDVKVGNTYTMSVWFKTSDSAITPYIYLQAITSGATTDGKGITSAITEASGDNGTVVTVSFTAKESGHTRLRVMLGVKNFASGMSVWFDNLVVTETWSVENAIAAGRENIALTGNTTVTNLTIAEGQTIDLNGYNLTADNVFGVDNSALVDNSENKSGRLACAGNVALASNNPQLPVDDGSGKYLFVEPSMDASYQKMNWANENGFQFVFRPGFGSYDGGTVKQLIASGNSGVKIELKLTQLDAYDNGKSVTIDLTEKGIEQAVYSNGTAFSAVFTNPGDAQAYQVEVVVSACGVTFSSNVGGNYDNPADDNIYYYFASDFNNDTTVPAQFEGRGDYTVGSKLNSNYGDLTMAGTDGDRYVQVDASLGKAAGLVFDSDDILNYSNIVFELDVKYGSEVAKAVRFMAYNLSTGAKDLVGCTTSGQWYIRKQGSTSNTYPGAYYLTSDWQTIKIELDLENNMARVSLGGSVLGTYSIDAPVDGQFIFQKATNTAIFCMDNLKVYRYTDPNWSLK